MLNGEEGSPVVLMEDGCRCDEGKEIFRFSDGWLRMRTAMRKQMVRWFVFGKGWMKMEWVLRMGEEMLARG